jgi:hypothetical protein
MASPSRADAAAASVGATDLFVLRRVRGTTFVHFGGAGRGDGWAGLIEVSSDDEASLRATLESRRPLRLAYGGRELVFGPYYARAAASVPVTSDVVVVFGSDTQLTEPSDDALQSAGMLAADAVQPVTPAKVLADDLEELEAVRAMMNAELDGGVETSAELLGRMAAESLSCEVAVVYLEDGGRVVTAERGWSLDASEDEIRHALAHVLAAGEFPICVQDAAVVKLPEPLDREAGIRSFYLLGLTGPACGVLFLAHTDAAPRGFTLLCRRLGQHLAGVVSLRLGTVLTQEWCAAEAIRLHAEFGKLDASSTL